jgi:hypothetical protein
VPNITKNAKTDIEATNIPVSLATVQKLNNMTKIRIRLEKSSLPEGCRSSVSMILFQCSLHDDVVPIVFRYPRPVSEELMAKACFGGDILYPRKQLKTSSVQ